ncbi:MAG: PAS domain S-box protein, partial [Rhodoferax sp.]
MSRQLTMLERVGEMASIGGWRFDFATREVLWSAQTRRIHEVDDSFVPNESNVFQFYVPERREEFTRVILRLNQSGQPYVMDIEILTARNRRIWTRVHGETQVLNGKAISVWGTMQDITVQKNLELQLQASEARFRSLTDLSSDWYWETDASYRFLDVQARTTRSGAGFVSTPTGKCWWDVSADNMNAADWETFRQRLEARMGFRDIELQTADGDGAMVWVAISGAPMVGAEGQFAGYRGVGANITERKSAQLRIEHMAFYDALTGLPN